MSFIAAVISLGSSSFLLEVSLGTFIGRESQIGWGPTRIPIISANYEIKIGA